MMEKNEWLESFFNTTPDIVYFIDLEGRLQHWNLALETLCGLPPDKMKGSPCTEFVCEQDRSVVVADVQKVFDHGSHANIYHFIKSDGSLIPFHCNGTVTFDKNGNPNGFAGVGRDISERRHAEEKLHQQKQFSDDIINSLPGVFYMLNQQGRFVRVNHQFIEVSGYSEEEFKNISALDLFEGNDKNLIGQKMQEVFELGNSFADADLLTKSGKKIPYYFTGHRTIIDDQHFLVGLGIDITERKQIEESLVMTRMGADQSFDSLFWIASDARIIDVNDAPCRILGYSREEMLQLTVADIDVNYTEGRWPDHFDNLRKSQSLTFESQQRTKDGRLIPVEICTNYFKLRDQECLFAVVRDITDRKISENILRQYKAAIDTVHEGFWLTDAQGVLLEANQAYAELSGYSLDELRGMHISQLEEKEKSLEEVKAHIAKIIAQGSDVFETRHRHKDGHAIDIEVSTSFIQESQKFVVFSRDIRERKMAEELQHEKEVFFRTISENVEDFIAVLDLQGRRIYNNPAYADFFGGVDALKGTDSFAEIHPGDRERIEQAFKKTVETGIGHRAEFRFVLPNGSTHFMESSGWLIRNSQGEPLRVIVVSREITERKKAEARILDLAFRDELTKLPNRRLMSDRLELAMAVSKRSGLYSALMFLDLDNFKPLNDKYGHSAGDILLIEVARRLADCVREADTVARFGGDEFMVMLSELDEDRNEAVRQATIVAEKIRTALAELYPIRIPTEGKASMTFEHKCTTSIGVVMFANQEGSSEDMISWADAAMYQAKENGRNQIRFYEAGGVKS